MEPSERLSPPDWMNEPATRAVTAALTAEGAEVRFVGGCVRDSLAGRAIKDIDLATPAAPDRVIRLLEKAGLKAVPTGLDHGTVTAVSSGVPYEITTLRLDLETDGRWAKVAFTDDWEADAARRDFTFNALSWAPDGRLFDPFGGRADLAAGRVRFVGEAAQRIAEDRLRLLRFFRFHAHYGVGAPDADGLAAAAAAAPGLAALSAERIREEVLRLLAAPNPAPVIALMVEHAILAAVLPEVTSVATLDALVALEARYDGPDPLRRLVALLPAKPDLAAPGLADDLARRLRLSGAQKDRLAVLLSGPDSATDPQDPRALRRLFYRHGPERGLDLLLLGQARRATARRDETDHVASALAVLQAWEAPQLPVRGRDLQDLGVPEGRAIGDLLAELEAWWIAADFRPNREACLVHLRSCLAAHH